ncbi:DUF1775 domain-containing protein [Cereibacter changlensis]|uniref:DUF1775 domain-containing protein n=1 Tax=Cereibacter changlensis TaxID=402884 RepID=A0A4U0Z0P0_9RHOB|nr:DUF1775 domain-containing protein [Cereibacter changlensis]TKA97728.1 DUF1775 domain-containing protein [Cereibacter changlensis]
MLKTLALSALFAATASLASAHATLEQAEAPAESTYKGVMRIGHGCGAEPTLKVRIQIPEGVIAVKPMPKAGWTLEIVNGSYAKTYDYYETPMSEGVKELVWTGELSNDHYDEFVFRGRLTADLPAGSTVYFPTVQECANGAERWIEIPAEGQNPDDLEGPAPGVKLIEATHGH